MYLENRWKRLHMFGKSSFLDLEPSTKIHADSLVSLLTSNDDQIQKYSSMFNYNHNLDFQLFKVCFEYSGYASHFLFHARLVTCKSAKKWYLMCMYIS